MSRCVSEGQRGGTVVDRIGDGDEGVKGMVGLYIGKV